ncbi:putative tubulin--tyrosine ligase PBY1 [Cyphellophora attinorum]|uniref:Putative tubulin--tyrosine ligase PBY1 n=1 Tax=Cyphellophora attinorum TaxID=1664694 RepID=A0A0N1P158_9EURO|nr:putative tubulin--tyrosine ligase PBY1 [Phialophora attinorum]KPI41207.1 putative tubulin--tyrosine ligase PBY1 [Phialophora attinorum]
MDRQGAYGGPDSDAKVLSTWHPAQGRRDSVRSAFNDGQDEWVLVDGTPASCTQLGLHHVFRDRGPIDLVVSGPNYGRNTTALFALSSGTLGAALEGAVNGYRSIALSFAFDSQDHDIDIITEAAKLSVRLVEKFAREWAEDVHVYSINVPVRKGVSNNKILYTEMIQNKWSSGSSYREVPAGESDAAANAEERKIRENEHTNGDSNATAKNSPKHRTFKWAPHFQDVKISVENAGSGDGYEVSQGNVSVTPLRANFWPLPQYKGEIKLNSSVDMMDDSVHRAQRTLSAVIDYPDSYVQPLIESALQQIANLQTERMTSLSFLATPTSPVLQIRAYEDIDFEHALANPSTSLVCAYAIRKALIRKHYLSNTVSTWLVKHPASLLASSFKACTHFELDYAEFLDEALVDAWDLNESMARNADNPSVESHEWWILKPGMSDGGNGIRLFCSLQQLQEIFEGWEEDEPDEDEDEDEAVEKANQPFTSDGDTTDGPGGAMTSQLRHFIAQPYIQDPLIFRSYGQRKFHIRTYVVAVGALRIYVYKEMLALFASTPYVPPSADTQSLELAGHLTNTCFQHESTKDDSVHRFWELHTERTDNWQEKIFADICAITGEVFEAAAREQMVHFQTLPNAFEVFGVDFLVDSNLNVWLLELNAYPDFKQTGKDLQDVVIGGLFRQVLQVAVQPFFTHSQEATHPGTERLPLVRSVDLGRR